MTEVQRVFRSQYIVIAFFALGCAGHQGNSSATKVRFATLEMNKNANSQIQGADETVDGALKSVADWKPKFGAELATYTTRYSGRSRGRGRNVSLAAKKVGRFVLAPQQTFSFNGSVGPRTRRRGFHGGPGIRKGLLVKDDVGGGVCQVSSTLHAAAVLAGLEIVEARPHSRPSSYIPMGLDAMVSYGRSDMKFRNPYAFPIAVEVKTTGRNVIATILGLNRVVKTRVSHEVLKRYRYRKRNINDDALIKGQRVLVQRGRRGYKVRRTIVIAGGSRAGTYTDVLVYRATHRVYRVGTKPSMIPSGRSFASR